MNCIADLSQCQSEAELWKSFKANWRRVEAIPPINKYYTWFDLCATDTGTLWELLKIYWNNRRIIRGADK